MDYNYDEHIVKTSNQRLDALGMCIHGLWKHENCTECKKGGKKMGTERLEVLVEEVEAISDRLAEQFRSYQNRFDTLRDAVEALRTQLDYCIEENEKLKDCLMQYEEKGEK